MPLERSLCRILQTSESIVFRVECSPSAIVLDESPPNFASTIFFRVESVSSMLP